MTFRLVESDSNYRTRESFDNMTHALKQGLRMGAYISGKEMTKSLRAELTKKGRGGRSYRIYKGLAGRLLKSPRAHRASSPSEYPAVISGDFRKSIGFKVKGHSQLIFGSGEDNLAKKYAKALEFGTSKMKARKPVGRVVKRYGNKVKTNLNREINKIAKI